MDARASLRAFANCSPLPFCGSVCHKLNQSSIFFTSLPYAEVALWSLHCNVSMGRDATAPVVERSDAKEFAHMELSTVMALSTLDGRYVQKVKEVPPFFSEYGLIRFHVLLEVK